MKIKFEPGDSSYRWETDVDSPFSKRNIALFSFDKTTKKKLLLVKEKYYQLYFTNTQDIYLSRNQPVALQKKQPRNIRFIKDCKLPGNIKQIHFSIEVLLKHIISSFETDPYQLFEESRKIRRICAVEGFTIPIIETFNKLNNWNEFMQLLKSIYQNNSPFKFELLIAAITQYSDLCSQG